MEAFAALPARERTDVMSRFVTPDSMPASSRFTFPSASPVHHEDNSLTLELAQRIRTLRASVRRTASQSPSQRISTPSDHQMPSFDDIDTNSDGVIDREEWHAAYSSRARDLPTERHRFTSPSTAESATSRLVSRLSSSGASREAVLLNRLLKGRDTQPQTIFSEHMDLATSNLNRSGLYSEADQLAAIVNQSETTEESAETRDLTQTTWSV